MSDNQLFSQFYSADTNAYEDKQKFRSRVLKYLEDFTQRYYPRDTYLLCRSKMGITLKTTSLPHGILYNIEDTFITCTPISVVLDFITVVYDSIVPHLNEQILEKDALKKFINSINEIFQEESMCYVLHDNGRVRYYPDEEFHQAVKATLVVLSKPNYTDNLKAFNDVLDELYNNHSKESPIHEFFKCIEAFVLSCIRDKKFKQLNDSSIDKLLTTVTCNINLDSLYADHDKEAAAHVANILKNWAKMCHKYRHGKADQTNNDVPPELFNLIFSTGISIFRFLLDLDDKYNLKP